MWGLLVFNVECGVREVLSSRVVLEQSQMKRMNQQTSGEGALGGGNSQGRGRDTSTPGKKEDHWGSQWGRRAVREGGRDQSVAGAPERGLIGRAGDFSVYSE